MTRCSIKFFELNIFFGFIARGEGFLVEEVFEMCESFLSLCYDHQTVCFLIQSMQQSCSDEVAYRREVFVSMIEKSDDRRFIELPKVSRMGEDSFGFIDDEIIFFFQDDRDIDIRCFLQYFAS